MKLIYVFMAICIANNVMANAELLDVGWSGKYLYGVGYSTSLLGSPAFIYDRFSDGKSSTTYFLGFSKSSSTTNTSTTDDGTSIVETNTGTKSIGNLTLALSFNTRIYRNEWTNLRIGFLAGINYFLPVEYTTGSKTTTIATGVDTYSSYGNVSVKKDLQLLIGPVVYTGFNLRWFPMITVGMDGGIIYAMKSTQTSTTTSNTGGVTTTTTSKLESGESSTMNGNGTFGFSTSFSIRYVW